METPQSLNGDPRYLALRNGLEQLNHHQLTVLEKHVRLGRPIVLDGCNYNPMNRTWCPLAVALQVDRVARNEDRELRTDAEAREYILTVGRRTNPRFSLNPMSGIVGRFFTHSRRDDLLIACKHVLEEKMFYRGSNQM